MRTIIILALTTLLFSAACVSQAQHSPENSAVVAERTPAFLTEDAVRSLLSDVVVAPVGDPNVIDSRLPAEIFLSHGNYERAIHRIRMSGTFYFSGNSVCVSLSGVAPLCRLMIANPDGTYVFVDSAGARSGPMTISPYR
jgi:hypothetical protein